MPSGDARELLARTLARRSPLPIVLRNARGEVSATRLETDSDLPKLAYATLFLPTNAGGCAADSPIPQPAIRSVMSAAVPYVLRDGADAMAATMSVSV